MSGAPTDFWTKCPEVSIQPGGQHFLVLAVCLLSFLHGRDFMQTQVKYEREIKQSVLGDRVVTIENLTPILTPQERQKREREVERRLFDVFVKYAGRRG